MIKLPNRGILLAKDNMSVFVDLDSSTTRNAGIDWSGVPEEIGYSYPYLIAILPKHVEVRNVETQTLVQTVELPQARLINQGKYLYIASFTSVWRFIPFNFDKQIDQLVDQHQYEEAISLTEQIEPILLHDKEAKLRQIRNLLAHDLFQQQKFDEAITIFQELETDPAEVIALYPPSISGTLYSGALHQQNLEKSETNHENGLTSVNSDQDEKISKNEEFINEQKQQILLGKLLEDAVSVLIRFLTDRRQKISKTLHPQPQTKSDISPHANGNYDHALKIAELVDTALLKSYMFTNEALVGPLLRVPNHCNVEECEGLLLERKKYKELVDLYHGKGLHRKSLDLLKKLGQSPDGGKMKGVFHAIYHMHRLGVEHFDLILEYAAWVLETDPVAGLEIFIDEHPEVMKFSRERVLKYLEGFSYDLCIMYLEHIIGELHDPTPDFHNKLIINYLNKIQRLSSHAPSDNSDLSHPPSGSEAETSDEINKKLLKFLETSTHYKAEKILGHLPLDDFYEARAVLLSRLGQHDQALNIYVHKLQNEQLAEEYCVKNYKDDDPKKNVFISLLRVYLRPNNGEHMMIEPAMRLLSRHGSRINASDVLNMIPSSTKISQLYSFFEKNMRESNRNRNMNLIVKNLLKANQVQAEEQLMFYRSRRVKIDEDRMCPQCTRRIGHSVFAVFPNGVVVHYHCKDKYAKNLE
ncbi:vacuolar sorting protein 39 domain 2-domain-containing protein [Gigaspora rosea]|uniref:Vacuolar sorting protein 39 domain 2-domain-containing protein n=1 Tax=Gigaspora rosea TaxID=44941 RepID=A0A397TZF3_9GLOM|nr:vacuolar sorting protein 39 domain 2-domain-containing protein [Gigaspora rosea]